MSRIPALLATAVVLVAGLVSAPAGASTPAPERTTYQPRWHQVHFHMNAYRGAGEEAGCINDVTDARGMCTGYGERGLSAGSYPFNRWVQWQWSDTARDCPDIPGRDTHHWYRQVRLTSWNGDHLCGWVDRHWGTYRLTGGKIMEHGEMRPVLATSGVVADREHVQGGPLFMFLADRSDGMSGYVMGLRGWLYY